MTPLAKKADERYTYADYLGWNDGERWELIEGVPYCMTPAPNMEHQSISGELFGILWQFLKGKPCRVFAAPFDVRMPAVPGARDGDIETVVQPDISVICDESKIDARGCLGAPDITVEILSPSTAYRDETEKLKLYEKHGVKEYWIVNPEAKYMMIYRLADGKYGKPDYLMGDDILESRVLQGFRVPLREIWGGG
jgi:Uma2 family endonuclease